MKITIHSPLDCPKCGHTFDGTWFASRTPASQTCPSCGHVFTATGKAGRSTQSKPRRALSRPSGCFTRRRRHNAGANA